MRRCPLWPEPLARAYAACEALARSHYENFPVASRLLPARDAAARRRPSTPLRAWRTTSPTKGRAARPSAWRGSTRGSGAFTRPSPIGDASSGSRMTHEDLIVVALAHSIRSLDLPLALFDDLLSAFGQDTMTTRYDSWADVFDYCRRSANPVGRLVLRIAGYRDEALDRSSDALCTALQLTNFWQDFGRDWRAGRLYVPRDVQRAVRRATKTDLAAAAS